MKKERFSLAVGTECLVCAEFAQRFGCLYWGLTSLWVLSGVLWLETRRQGALALHPGGNERVEGTQSQLTSSLLLCQSEWPLRAWLWLICLSKRPCLHVLNAQQLLIYKHILWCFLMYFMGGASSAVCQNEHFLSQFDTWLRNTCMALNRPHNFFRPSGDGAVRLEKSGTKTFCGTCTALL